MIPIITDSFPILNSDLTFTENIITYDIIKNTNKVFFLNIFIINRTTRTKRRCRNKR
jgi:hypothetical protein